MVSVQSAIVGLVGVVLVIVPIMALATPYGSLSVAFLGSVSGVLLYMVYFNHKVAEMEEGVPVPRQD